MKVPMGVSKGSTRCAEPPFSPIFLISSGTPAPPDEDDTMNDYAMSNISREHMAQLHAEAQRSRLAHEAESGSGRDWLRRAMAAVVELMPGAGERDDEAWASSPQRRDAWSGDHIAR